MPEPQDPLEVRPTGNLVIGQLVVGSYMAPFDGKRPTLSINVGPLNAAGVRLVVTEDPDADKGRGAIILER